MNRQTFAGLGIGPALTNGLAKAGISAPTDIQSAVIPLVLTGRDVIG